MVPDEEKIKVNDKLGPNSRINNNYSCGGSLDMDDGGKKKKKEAIGKKGKKGKKKK